MKKIILSTITALMLVTNMQAKALDADLANEIEVSIVDIKKELPIQIEDKAFIENIKFNKANEEMITQIVIHNDFDMQIVNSSDFKDILANDTATIKKEACELELTQSLKEYENFKITYIYYKNKISDSNKLFETTVYASSCN